MHVSKSSPRLTRIQQTIGAITDGNTARKWCMSYIWIHYDLQKYASILF